MACIYKITNLVNNKIYIGQTIFNTCAHRWKYYRNIIGKNYAPNVAIVNALNKYGYDNFKFECIESNIDLEQLDDRERYWIAYYNSYKEGYNETTGGDGRQTLTPELADEIVTKYLEIKVISKVADFFHLDSATISKLLDVLNIHKFTQWEQLNNRLESEVIPDIITLYNKGYSITRIHKELKISKDFITKKLKEQGLDTDTKRKIKDKEELLKLYKANNCNAKRTAEQLGVTITTVTENLKIFGIDTNHRVHRVEDR